MAETQPSLSDDDIKRVERAVRADTDQRRRASATQPELSDTEGSTMTTTDQPHIAAIRTARVLHHRHVTPEYVEFSDGHPGLAVGISDDTYAHLGSPEMITVTIEPGDTLNPHRPRCPVCDGSGRQPWDDDDPEVDE